MRFFTLGVLLILTTCTAQAQRPNVKADTLYLKILKQRKMLPAVNDTAFYRHMEQFDTLEDLRASCKSYLNTYAKSPDDPKYKQVTRIQLSLKDYPVARVQFDEIMHLRNTTRQP